VAATGTHDTEPLALWWDGAGEDERRKIGSLPSIQRLAVGIDLTYRPFDATVRDVLLEALFASPSDLVLLPVQDAFGWRARINEPGLIADENWTFKLPWTVDALDDVAEARERKDQLLAWSEKYGRR
jgi:4-alpha-glucanotransferase